MLTKYNVYLHTEDELGIRRRYHGESQHARYDDFSRKGIQNV